MCREFYCLWQGGVGEADARPDRLGAIFAPTNGPTEFTGEEEFQAYEVVEGAFGNPRVVRIAKTLAKPGVVTLEGKLVVGHRFGGKVLTFIGPKWKVEAAQRWVNEGRDRG